MSAEVIAIGDELTSGRRLDTNSQWLSQQLALLGLSVSHHTTVADDLEAIVAALATACARSEFVVVSGGLGPTADDLTRQAIAAVTGRPLVLDEPSLDHIRRLFESRGRAMPERNSIQAHFPAGARPIANPHGTAPGVYMRLDREGDVTVELFALPGVPAELVEMWSASVVPAIAARLGTSRRVICQREIRCFGAGESEIESRLPDLVRRGRDPVVGITATQATITLRITADGATEAECEAKIAPTAKTIYDCLGSLIYGEGEVELQDAVCQLLAHRKCTLATAEWGTAGLVASWLGGVSDNTRGYRGGLIVDDLPALDRALGRATPAEVQHTFECDAQQLVAHMALAVSERFASDYGLAVGPFPLDEDATASAARVHLAVACRGQAVCDSLIYASHPAIQRIRCAKQALNLMRLTLLQQRV